MPRTPKREDEFELDPEAAAEAVAEVQEDLAVEEAAAAFFAAQAKSGEGEEGEAAIDEVAVGPVLGVADGEADGGSTDSAPAEAEDDAGGAGEEPAGPEESEVEAEEVAAPVRRLNSAESRPTTAGGLTVITQ